MKVIHFPLKINYVNSFLCFDEKSQEAFLVDCGAFEDQINNFIQDNNLNLKFLLITHSHYDHNEGINDFKKAFKVPIYSSTKEYDKQVSQGDKIPFGSYKIKVFETTGHTPDSVSYYIENAVFVGDAIFSGAVGGTANRPQFKEQINQVWNKILTLPEETVIYPGHGVPTLVGIERVYNPFFD
ncbi:MAG: hydroxyacylglutathione hydrolase family protein [bacterium]